MVGINTPKVMTYDTNAMFQDAAVEYLCTHLIKATKDNSRTTLFLSGGSTPGPIYRELASRKLKWSKISIAQVDDRWVGLKDPGSNARLLRKTMLTGNGAKALFKRMKSRHRNACRGQQCVEADYQSLPLKNSVAVLGMGMDGHVCSWFPNAKGTERAIDPTNENLVQAIMARPSKVTGPYLERMTLTLSALTRCKSLLLLVKGQDKRDLIQKAIHDRPDNLPVSHLLNAVGDRLTIMCTG